MRALGVSRADRDGVHVKPGKPGHLLVDLGIVLHRARAQRIEALVHAVVQLGQPHEMPHEVDLAHLGQGRDRRAADASGGRW